MTPTERPDDEADELSGRKRLMAEQERLLRLGVPLEALARLSDAALGGSVGVSDKEAGNE